MYDLVKLNAEEIDALEAYSDNSKFFQSLLEYQLTHGGCLTRAQYAKFIDMMESK